MQPREKSVLEFFDRSWKLTIKSKEYRNFVKEFFNLLLKNDLKNADLTTESLIGRRRNTSAYIIAKEDGILAGIEEFSLLNQDLELKFLKKDGDKIKNNDKIAEMSGNAGKILSRERINLNLLQRMSGIAALTEALSKKSGKTKIAATRKTLWGALDKKAVSVGGGLTHRLSLDDGILIKDNHLQMLSFDAEQALELAEGKSKYIEIEVENGKDALSAAKAIKKLTEKSSKSVFAIMLDKIEPQEIKSIVDELKGKDFFDNILLEASGNINSSNIREYANCGADVASIGQITNSAKVLNMSLEIENEIYRIKGH